MRESSESILNRLHETVNYIQSQTDFKPEFGIILGTGLGALATEIERVATIEYGDIPHFPVSTVESHQGRLIFGYLEGKKVVVMQGRFHYYEGYSLQEVTWPVRAMKFLGVDTLFVSNAAGGINTALKNGDLMIINDHILLLPDSPLRGTHVPEFGARFPEQSKAYDKALIQEARAFSRKEGIRTFEGCYAAISGPQLETQAEYRYLGKIGADAVGMSTVPEVIVARQMGMRCFAISVITDIAFPEELHEVTLEEILAIANEAEPKMTKLLKHLLSFC